MSVVLWIMAIIFVEAVTEIIINGDIFLRLREFLYNLSKFTGSLVGCGYCLSVWVSASIAWALPVGFSYTTLNYIVAVFVLHRLSNIFHELVSRWLGRIPWTLQLHKTEQVMIED
jgi:hypothetical protein